MASTLSIVVSYVGREEIFAIDVKPGIELRDEQIDRASEKLWKSLRQSFELPVGIRLTLHEAETGRIFTKETFRDPSFIPHFPKYWYLTVDNGYSSSTFNNQQFLSEEYQCSDLAELLLMERYSPLSGRDDIDGEDDNEESLSMYPSLMELSMGHSPSLQDSREDLMALSLDCNKEGLFGVVFRHFTVVANVPHSDHSSSESSSRSGSRCSTHSSSDSYDTLHMSTLYVHSVTEGGPAELVGLQNGDIIHLINGQSISGNTTDEIITLIEESGPKLTLWISPEHHDDLLPLYPKYVQGDAGVYKQSASEKIIVSDITVRTKNLTKSNSKQQNNQPDPTYNQLSNHHNSIPNNTAQQYTHVVHSDIDPYHMSYSTNSLSSGGIECGYHSSNDDLLITASLADIPTVPSPLARRRMLHKPSRSFDRQSEISQEWLSQEGDRNDIEWFPEADSGSSKDFTYSLPTSLSKNEQVASMSQSGEYSVVQSTVVSSGTNRLAQKLKNTLRNLKMSSSTSTTNSSHQKITKTSSLGVVQTRSTSALDRLKVNISSNGNLATERSRSTDLGQAKIKNLSLEALTKVDSDENISKLLDTRKRGSIDVLSYHNKVLPLISYTRPSVPNIKYQSTEPSSDLSLPMSQEKNLSGDSCGSGHTQSSVSTRGRSNVGRSYRIQREKLHQTRSHPSRVSTQQDKKDNLSSPIATTAPGGGVASNNNSPNLTNVNRRHVINSNDSLSFTRIGADRRQRHNRYDDSPTELTHSPNHVLDNYNTGAVSESPHNGKTTEHRRSTGNTGIPLSRSRSFNEDSLSDQQQTSIGHKQVHKALSAQLNTSVKPKKLATFNSVFHGPINKKQERGSAGRKSMERSWHSIYAAIQGHWMVFYSTVQDALTGQPLENEPSLNLHHCMVTVLPRKKHVFRLSFVDGSECLIQAENEESMMRWMRIIHNLNRMRRLGPPPPQLQQHGSTQEDVPKQAKEGNKKMRRFYTPQPSKHETKEEPRKVFIDKLKRTLVRNKESTDGTESSTCYNTFGLPLEECPASLENKSVPLVVMSCLKELENKWLDTEGLYRVAGPMGQVRVLAEELNKGRLNLLENHSDPHVLTGILKKFLKELPNPVIPNNKYEVFIATAKEPDLQSRTEKFKELVQNLPPAHHHTLGIIIRHLIKVESHSKNNKMAQRNLCIVFGPTLVRKSHSEENTTLVADMNHTYTVIELLMNNVNDFFMPAPSSIMVKDEILTDSLSPPQKFSLNALRRGTSEPSCTLNGRQFHRSSLVEETSTRSLLTMSSQDLILSNDYSFSQTDSRASKPHRKSRLARTRHHLTSHEEEPQNDLVSPLAIAPTRSLTSPPPPVSYSTVRSPQRKISYTSAIQESPVVGTVDFDGSTGQHLISPTSNKHIQLHKNTRNLDRHKYRWSADYSAATNRVLDTEIVGPSSADWNNSWSANRSRVLSVVSSRYHTPESRL